MIATTSDLNSATIILRRCLIENSQLDSERVLNSLSLTGTELDELLEDSIYNSIDHANNTLLFEISDSESSSNMSENNNNNITYYKMFNCHIIIYGDNSNEIALALSSRMRNDAVCSNLYAEGIFIANVSNPQSVNEFKNDSMWLRNDFNITFGLKFSIPQIITNNDYKVLNKLKIIKEEN